MVICVCVCEVCGGVESCGRPLQQTKFPHAIQHGQKIKKKKKKDSPAWLIPFTLSKILRFRHAKERLHCMVEELGLSFSEIFVPILVSLLILVCELGPRLGRKWQPTPVFLPGKSHGQRSQKVGHN